MILIIMKKIFRTITIIDYITRNFTKYDGYALVRGYKILILSTLIILIIRN